MNARQIIEKNKEFVMWLDTLVSIPEQIANEPYQAGKWSPKMIIMHMAEWDRFTVEKRLPFIKEDAVLEAFPDFESFNKEAAAKSHGMLFSEIVATAKTIRLQLIKKLEQFDENEWKKTFKIGTSKLTLQSYFEDFLCHDKQHQTQVESIRK